MPIEAKDILDALKLPSVETKEELVKAIDEAGWIQEEQIFKDEKLGERIFGRAFGTSTTNVAKTFRKLGVEITGADLKNPIEKVVETGLNRLNESWEAKRQEIESTSKLNIDERVKAAEEAKGSLAKKVKELEDLVTTKAQEFESLLGQKETEVATIKLSTLKAEAERDLKFLPDLDPYKKKGWLAEMNEKYRIEPDEVEGGYIVDAATGSRIKSTQHAGTFLSIKEVYQQDAAKAGIIVVAANGGKPAPVIKTGEVIIGGQKPVNPGRIVAASAQVK